MVTHPIERLAGNGFIVLAVSALSVGACLILRDSIRDDKFRSRPAPDDRDHDNSDQFRRGDDNVRS